MTILLVKLIKQHAGGKSAHQHPKHTLVCEGGKTIHINCI